MSEPPAQDGTYAVQCPHCGRDFTAELLEGAAARSHGCKCPHCRLFVPLERAEEQELAERAD